MKRSREEDFLVAQPRLQNPRSHDEAGPSNSGVINRVHEPTHDIFFSHSGQQKDFVELVYWELKKYGYNPFFDGDPYSLPEGQCFPPLIFDAVRSCPVAIFLLSEDFFTNSKWPMLELVAAVESLEGFKEGNFGKEKILLPVLFKDFTKDVIMEKRQGWKLKWEEFKRRSKDGQIDVDKWVHALDDLLKRKWIAYDGTSREHGLIQSIVASVCRSLPPPNPRSDGKVQGIEHIHHSVLELIAKSPSNDVRIVGIHGVGGIGKTTLCKDLCDYMYKEFVGKVCHVELGSLAERELKIGMLEQLHANLENLKKPTDAKIDKLLEKCVSQQKVFLALDNVWPHSREEVNFYLRLRFCRGSIVLVTARDIDVLRGLSKVHASPCMEMPELEKEDARRLFLQHAAPDYESKSEKDKRNIRKCLHRCYFSKGENKGNHFHPLALKVLGCSVQCLGPEPSLWVESISNISKLKPTGEIMDFLRKGYDELENEDQLLFMDVALFYSNIYTDLERTVFYEGLRSFHPNSSLESIKMRLQGLKARALIEDIGDGVGKVSVHDLYVEFAQMEATKGVLDGSRWIWHDGKGGVPKDLWKTPSGNCWPNIERIRTSYSEYNHFIQENHVEKWDGSVEGIKWQHFANVVVLDLHIGEAQTLNLRGLLCMRILKLNGNDCTLKGLGELRDVRWLDLIGFFHTPCLEKVGQLTKLEFLRCLTRCKENRSGDCSQPLESLDIDNFDRLLELDVECNCLKMFPNLLGMKSLRKIEFKHFHLAIPPLDGPDQNTLSRQNLTVQEMKIYLCTSICCFNGLASLQVLDLFAILELQELPDVYQLNQLQKLSIDAMPHLLHLPIISGLVALEELYLRDLPEVKGEFPCLILLTRLRKLVLKNIPNLTGVVRIGDLVALEHLGMVGLPKVARKIPDMRSLKQLEGFLAGDIPWVKKNPLSLVKRMPLRYGKGKWEFDGDIFKWGHVDVVTEEYCICGLEKSLIMEDHHPAYARFVIKQFVFSEKFPRNNIGAFVKGLEDSNVAVSWPSRVLPNGEVLDLNELISSLLLMSHVLRLMEYMDDF